MNRTRNSYRDYTRNFINIDTLCDDCKKRYEKNPLRILDCKVDGDNEVLKNVQFIPSYTVDFIYHNVDVKPEDITDIATLKNLWGQGIEEALIALEDVPVTAENLNLMAKDKNPTLKITLPNKISIIKFKSSEEEFEKLYTEHGKVSINIIGRCSVNEWNGIITPQILVEDYEIISRSEYYF